LYSLVSSSVLASDLMRQPLGGELLDLFARAMRLTEDELGLLARAGDDGRAAQRARVRTRAYEVAALRPTLLDRVAAAGEAVQSGTVGTGTTDMLAGASHADLGELTALLSGGILGWAGPEYADGVQAVTDGLAALWCAPELELADALLLGQPWQRLIAQPEERPLAVVDLGPQGAQLRALVLRIAQLDPFALDRVAVASRAYSTWAADLHSASWAAHLTGRLESVAHAQLAAAGMLMAAPRLRQVSMPLRVEALRGIAAAVQATAVADLLFDAVADRLLAPWGYALP
jgi:hypothetical protein